MPPRAAAADIEDADTVDGEVATEWIVPVPKLGLQPKLAPRAVQSFKGGGFCMPSSRLRKCSWATRTTR